MLTKYLYGGIEHEFPFMEQLAVAFIMQLKGAEGRTGDIKSVFARWFTWQVSDKGI